MVTTLSIRTNDIEINEVYYSYLYLQCASYIKNYGHSKKRKLPIKNKLSTANQRRWIPSVNQHQTRRSLCSDDGH